MMLLGPFVYLVAAGFLSSFAFAERFSNVWKDTDILAPRNFKVTPVGECRYQLTFERDVNDNRYTFAFDALYDNNDGYPPSLIFPDPVGEGLPISTPGPIASTRDSPSGRYTLSATRELSVYEFDRICSPPDAFRVYAIQDIRYDDVSNEFRSAPIAPTGSGVPAVPKNVVVTVKEKQFTVTWDKVPNATGYFMLSNYTTPLGGHGSDINGIRTVRAGADATSARITYAYPNTVKAVAVVARGPAGVVSDTLKVPVQVPQV